jgi:hypothetical protein
MHDLGRLEDLAPELDSLPDEERAAVLSGLASRLSPGNIPSSLGPSWRARELLRAVRRIVSSSARLSAFTALVPHLSDDLLNEALAVTANFPGGEERIRALAAVAGRLSEPFLKQVREQARAIPHPAQKAKALVALAGYLPEDERKELLTTACQLPSLIDRVEALTVLAAVLPSRAAAFAREAALEAFRQMRDPLEQATAIRLIPSVKEAVTELGTALEAASITGNRTQRRVLLEQLAPWLARLEACRLHDAWQRALPVLALRSRRELLGDLQALLVVLVRLAGPRAFSPVCRAVESVREWWP